MFVQVDALWQPDLHLLPGNVGNAYEGLENISADRVGVKCVICERSDGAIIRCSQGHCSIAFHPLCARNAGQYLSVHPTGTKTVYKAFCAHHSQQARNKDRELGISIEVMLAQLGISPQLVVLLTHPSMGATIICCLIAEAMSVTAVHVHHGLAPLLCQAMSVFPHIYLALFSEYVSENVGKCHVFSCCQLLGRLMQTLLRSRPIQVSGSSTSWESCCIRLHVTE